MTPNTVIQIHAELLASRLLTAQLLAYVAAKQDDRDLFIANIREAAMRSLEQTRAINGGDDATVGVLVFDEARSLIEQTLDEIGRAGHRSQP